MTKNKKGKDKTAKWIVTGQARKGLTVKCPSCGFEIKSVTSKPKSCPKCSARLK